ncbi:hypothetical protein [Streptomyces bluensis]|uniref:Uncharacterized protein n=1 Tax=Streptomyces bluensis TaxID=33897 RepID=A0ABW6UKJ6_9ACTN
MKESCTDQHSETRTIIEAGEAGEAAERGASGGSLWARRHFR